ncbi:MAG: ABC transporter substrate-binding protein [Magnetococcales bacterium]|nr:ABC transporter substrate-binding protein [Magnetococcales bacterium]
MNRPVRRSRYGIRVALAAMIGLCASPMEAWSAQPLRITCTTSILTALMDVAKLRGLFERHGVFVAMEEAPTSEAAIRELLEGRAEIVTVSDLSIALHGFEQPGLRVMATIGVSRDEFKILTRANAPASLRDKVVALLPDSPAAHYFLHLFQLKNDMHVRTPDSPPDSWEKILDALEAGTIDGFAGREPYLREAAIRLNQRVTLHAEPGLYERSFQLLTRQEVLDGRHAEVRGILLALLEAQRHLKADPQGFFRTVADNTGLKPAELERDARQVRLSVTLDQELLLTLEHQVQWAREHRMVSRDSASDFLPLMSVYPLKALVPHMVNIIR